MEEELEGLRADQAVVPLEEVQAETPVADLGGQQTETPAQPRAGGAAPAAARELPYEDYDDESGFLSPLGDLNQRRLDLDRERADRELELGDEPFWMVCAKCGEHLSEHEFDNIKIERCDSCGGVWIDKGEVDLLLFCSEDDRALAYRVRGLLV